MTVFRTQLKLQEKTKAHDIWDSYCEWIIGTSYHRSEDIVTFCKENKTDLKNLDESFFYKKDKCNENLKVFYFDTVELFYIIFSQQYENGIKYETTIVFNGLEKSKLLSYETNVFGKNEKSIKFTKSTFFNYLTNLLSKDDLEKRFYNTKEINDISNLPTLMKKGSYLLPFVYISRCNDGSYPYTDEELTKLAQKLYCCAYVFKESDKKTSLFLKDKTGGLNPYNGAVGLFVGKQRRIYFDKNIDQITDKITKLLCINPLSEKVTVTFVKNYFINQTKNVLEKIINTISEELSKPEKLDQFLEDMQKGFDKEKKAHSKQKQQESKELEFQKQIEEYKNNISALQKQHQEEIDNIKQKYENLLHDKEEMIDYVVEENDEKDQKINELHITIDSLTSQIETYKYRFEGKKTDYTININCSEKELFAGEITDYLNGLMYENFIARNKNPISKREKDVVEKLIVENNGLNWNNSNSCKLYETIKKDIIKNCHSSFYKEKREPGHHITEFCGDSRYVLTEPGTPGDNVRGSKNLASCAEQHFLKPVK